MRLFCVLFVLSAGPAWAQSPGDNPVADAYHRGSFGTPGDNFLHNSYERRGAGTVDDNFMRDLATSPRSHRNYELR